MTQKKWWLDKKHEKDSDGIQVVREVRITSNPGKNRSNGIYFDPDFLVDTKKIIDEAKRGIGIPTGNKSGRMQECSGRISCQLILDKPRSGDKI